MTGKKVLAMNKPTVQDIFLRFYPAYLEKYSPSPEQAKVSRNIINCKTGAYGANVSICEDCGTVQIHYNSCRNRCCPMCQAVPKEMWMDARREDVLDAPYFHLVFTVPDLLNQSFTVIRSNCMTPCITLLLLQSVNWLLTQSILGLPLDISASCIHGVLK